MSKKTLIRNNDLSLPISHFILFTNYKRRTLMDKAVLDMHEIGMELPAMLITVLDKTMRPMEIF
jgi:hypothetical protein